MDLFELVGAGIAIGLLVYLAVALLAPESLS